jgi:DNA-binding transcriptional regulator LsrR (DeoR family)
MLGKINQKELALKLGLNPGTINRELKAAAESGELEMRTSPLGTEVRLRA